jgi:hypothetical protein
MVGGEKLIMFVALKLARFSCGLFYSPFPNHFMSKLTFVARMGIGIGIAIQFFYSHFREI